MLFLGVDGGGTKTEAILCDDKLNILKRALCNGCNPNDIGIESSFQILKSITDTVIKGRNPSDISAFYGISGCYNNSNTVALLKRIKENYDFSSVDLNSDIINVFSGELYDGNMCILISGTGSVAFSKCGDCFKRVGGWGYIIDDKGSGYDIGRNALNAVFREHDGRGENTVLTQYITSKYDLGPDDLITKIYRIGRKEIASLTPFVTEGYYRGDKICEAILKKAAKDLAILVEAACKDMTDEKIRVILCGGVLKNNEIIVEMLKSEVSDRYELISDSMPPVFGAIAKAAELSGIRLTNASSTKFRKEYIRS